MGKGLKIIKPNKQEAEVPLAPDKDRATASFLENDRAGIYRLSLPVGGRKESGMPLLYAANSPFLESPLTVHKTELQANSPDFPSK